MTPFYSTLADVHAFGVEATANDIGLGVVAGTAGLFLVHGVGKSIQHHLAARNAGGSDAPVAGPEAPKNPEVKQ
jgi:hypothetical protein